METILAFFEKIIAMFLSLFNVFTGMFGFDVSYEPISKNELLFSAAIISDTHIDALDQSRIDNLKTAIDDINHSEAQADAFIFVGDATHSGTVEQFQAFSDTVSALEKETKFVLAIGNSDTKQGNDSFSAFYSSYAELSGRTVYSPYRHEVIKGYHFLTIGTERALDNQAYLSPFQLVWLDETLGELAGTNQPVFLIVHQPLNGTNKSDEVGSSGMLGEQSDQVLSILKKYTNQGMVILCLSGHLHSSLGYSGVSRDGSLYFVDCPSFGETPVRGGVSVPGTGYVMEIYRNYVVLRARHFVVGEFYNELVYQIPTNAIA